MKPVSQPRKYKLANLTEKDFPLAIVKHNANNHILHTHDFIELVIIEHGAGIHFMENSNYMITKGDILAIPKGMKHGYKNNEKLKVTNIFFNMSILDSFPKDIQHIPGFYSLFLLNSIQQKRALNKKGFLSLNSEEITYVKRLTSRITREQQEKRIGYRSVCVLVFADLIIFLSRKTSIHNQAVHNKKFAEVLCYMEKNYNKNISIEQLSHMTNMSERNFQRVFKIFTGSSPLDHLINIRLQHAKKMLKETELSVSEIAYSNGFSDSAYFTRQFKKIFSIPPTSYRKQVQD